MASPSPSPELCPHLLPLAERFKDMPEPMRTQITEATAKVIRNNIKEIYDCNVIHWLGGGVRRCKDCIVEFARAVDAAERAGVQVEEWHKCFLVEYLLRLQAGELRQPNLVLMMSLLDAVVSNVAEKEQSRTAGCKLRMQHRREKELKQVIEREIKKQPHISVMRSLMEQEEEHEEEEDGEDCDDDGELVWESDTGEFD